MRTRRRSPGRSTSFHPDLACAENWVHSLDPQPLTIPSFAPVRLSGRGSYFQHRARTGTGGAPLAPPEHVRRCADLPFPLAEGASLPHDVQGALRSIARPIDMVTAEWQATIDRVRLRALQLKPLANAVRSLAPPELYPVAAKVHLPLLAELMEETKIPGSSWLKGFIFGFPIVGDAGLPGVYPAADAQPPPIDPNAIGNATPERLAQRTRGGPQAHAKELWDQAILESSKGWLQGPLDLEALPEGSALAFRFGISQGGKLRAIDDLRASRTNEAAGPLSAIVLPTWDHTAEMILSLQDLLPGTPLGLAKADHKEAYKQLPLLPEHARYAVVYL